MQLLEPLFNYCDKGVVELRFLGDRVERVFMPLHELDAIPSEILARPSLNAYFGPVLRKPGSSRGTRDDLFLAPCLWVDVDKKDFGGDTQAAKKAIWEKCPLGVGKWTAIVETGGGYHCYLKLKEPAEPGEFSRLEKINRGLAKSIGGDIKSCDIAHILRLPLSNNLKYSPPRAVRLAYETQFEVDITELEYIEHLGADIAVPSSIGRGIRSQPIWRVTEQCRFIQWALSEAAHLPEPAWYAMISNLCRFAGCRSFIHEASRPHPKYSQAETDAKILHALDASGPISCERIKADVYNCERVCGVASPASLAWSPIILPSADANPFRERDERLKDLVEAAIPPDGFIRDYVDFASGLTDAPKVFHLFCGLSLLGSALGRRAWVPGFGGQNLFPNLWLTILAPSSRYRKSTAVGIAENLLRQAGINTLPQEFSRESLISMLQQEPHSTFIWSEFGSALGLLEKEYMAGTKDLLADLYDCPEQYRRILSQQTLEVRNPYISILAAGNIDWMLDKRSVTNDLRGGFLARMLYVPYTSKEREMDVPGVVDELWRARLVGFLRDLGDRNPEEFGISQLSEVRLTLNRTLDREANESEYIVELSAAFSRYKVAALKLALLYAISIGCWGEEIPVEAMMWASSAILLIKESLRDILRSTPLNRDDHVLVEVFNKMLQLHARGDAWVSRNDICRFTHRRLDQLRPILETLVEMGRIRRDGDNYQAID